MLINQNHELSIKLKKKNETIAQLNAAINQTYEDKKSPEKSDPVYEEADHSYESNYR